MMFRCCYITVIPVILLLLVCCIQILHAQQQQHHQQNENDDLISFLLYQLETEKIFASENNNNNSNGTTSGNDNGSASASASGGSGGLLWHDLSVESPTSILLHPSSGMVWDGQITALLGPSGAGKTTFLSALAGLSIWHVEGFVGKYDNSDNNNNDDILQLHTIPEKKVAWLQQHDDFFTMLTVEETMKLAIFLELPDITKTKRNEIVKQIAKQLGIQHTLKRKIGSNTVSQSNNKIYKKSYNNNNKNIIWNKFFRRIIINNNNNGGRLSGGERRRLSIGIELLTKQQEILITDEPTSGLDSTYSIVVMQLLYTLAQTKQIPIICSLHQPSSIIWNKYITNIILIGPGGRICYVGKRSNIISYIHDVLNYTIPDYTNPAEFLLDLVSINSEDPIQASIDEERIDYLTKTFTLYQKQQQQQMNNNRKKSNNRNKSNNENVVLPTLVLKTEADYNNDSRRKEYDDDYLDDNNNDNTNTNSIIFSSRNNNMIRYLLRGPRRFGALLKRSWLQNVRDVSLNINRLIISIGNALLLAGIFPTIRSGQIPLISSIADRVALLSFAAINLCMLSYMKAITLFANERPIIHRELSSRQLYTVIEYIIAKLIAELPLDISYTTIFTTILKRQTNLQITWKKLTSIFSLLTFSGVTLGYLLGSIAPSGEHAITAGIPILVVFMVVGVINPSGVDITRPKPILLEFIKQFSPFAYAIEALCLCEYPGVQYYYSMQSTTTSSSSTHKTGGFIRRLKNAPRMGGLALVTNGDQVIEALGLQSKTYHGSMKHLAIISVGNLFLSWLCMTVKQFQQRRRRQEHRKYTRNLYNNNKNNNQLTDDDDSIIISNHQQPIVKVPPRIRI